MFSLYNIYVLLYIQTKHLAQLVSVQGESAKDLGSIPRSQPLFLIFFHRQSNALQDKVFTVHHQYLALLFINVPRSTYHFGRTTMRLSQACTLDLGKVKRARIGFGLKSQTTPPPVANAGPSHPFFCLFILNSFNTFFNYFQLTN